MYWCVTVSVIMLHAFKILLYINNMHGGLTSCGNRNDTISIIDDHDIANAFDDIVYNVI